MIAPREMSEVTYVVPALSSCHSEDTLSNRLLEIRGVDAVSVDVETRSLTVYGEQLDPGALRTSIETAGYEAA